MPTGVNGGEGIIVKGTAHWAVVTGCDLHHNREHGCYVTNGTQNFQVTTNRIHHNCLTLTAGDLPAGVTPVTVPGGSGLQFNGYGGGIWDGLVDGNYIYSNSKWGILGGPMTRVTFSNNIIYDNGKEAVFLSGGSIDCQLLNNQIATNTRYGVILQNTDTTTVHHHTTGTIITGNCIYCVGTDAPCAPIDFQYTEQIATSGNNTFRFLNSYVAVQEPGGTHLTLATYSTTFGDTTSTQGSCASLDSEISAWLVALSLLPVDGDPPPVPAPDPAPTPVPPNPYLSAIASPSGGIDTHDGRIGRRIVGGLIRGYSSRISQFVTSNVFASANLTIALSVSGSASLISSMAASATITLTMGAVGGLGEAPFVRIQANELNGGVLGGELNTLFSGSTLPS